MYIAINYSGVREHVDSLERQLRQMQMLEGMLRRLYNQAAEIEADPASLRRCADCVRQAEQGCRRRMDGLRVLLEGMKQVDIQIDDSLQRLYRIQKEEIIIDFAAQEIGNKYTNYG